MNRRRTAKRRGYPPNLYDDDGYFYYRDPTTGKRKGLGRDKAFALSEARHANTIIANRVKSRLAQWVSGVETMTLKEWLPVYKELWCDHKKPAASTIKSVGWHLDRFAVVDFAHMPLSQITTLHVARYLDDLAADRGLAAATNMRTRLLDVFNWAITKGHVETGKNPVAPTIPPNYQPSRERLSLEQFLDIQKAARPWLVNAMNLALLTGQRISDVSMMRFTDIKDGHLEVAQMKSQGEMRLRIDVQIGLTEIGLTVADVVRQCRDRVVSQYLVHHPRTSGNYKAGDALSQDGISGAFSIIRDSLGIVASAEGKTPPTFHEIRSLSERMYRKERGKEFAQALLGHKTESMSNKYDDLRGSDWLVVSA